MTHHTIRAVVDVMEIQHRLLAEDKREAAMHINRTVRQLLYSVADECEETLTQNLPWTEGMASRRRVN